MAVKIPPYLTLNDTVLVPLFIKNNTRKLLSGNFIFHIPKNLLPVKELPQNTNINPGASTSILIPFVVKNPLGKDTLRIAFDNEKFKDAFSSIIEVQPKGFPASASLSGKDKEKHFSFYINRPVNNTISATFNAFPNIITDMLSGTESMLAEPWGCFEQASSTTYPNILVLEYLKEKGEVNKEIESKALKFIEAGYRRLISFETSEHGFDWFGHAPANEALTAYGLLEFMEMKNVYNKVDNDMVKRTTDWLLQRRDGKGNFKRNFHGYGFGNSSEEVSNAYIVYALSEAGIMDIQEEYKKAYMEAMKSLDPYRLALIANAASNLSNQNDYHEIMVQLNRIVQKANWDSIRIDHSITRSYGRSLSVETAAIYILAVLQESNINWGLINDPVKFLITTRKWGGFGSTQATVLALKALKEYTRLSKTAPEDGRILVAINDKQAVNYFYAKGDKGKIQITGLEQYFKEGKNTVQVEFQETTQPLPYTLDVSWNTMTPVSDEKCNVNLSTSLESHHSKVGETVRMNIKVQNKQRFGLPMTMAIIGIPSGLSLQPWQLKEIQEKSKVDFYEINRNYLVLYFRQMNPSETKELNLDLKAEIAGNYQAPASCTYLYYTNEFKKWTDGEYIEIEP